MQEQGIDISGVTSDELRASLYTKEVWTFPLLIHFSSLPYFYFQIVQMSIHIDTTPLDYTMFKCIPASIWNLFSLEKGNQNQEYKPQICFLSCMTTLLMAVTSFFSLLTM